MLWRILLGRKERKVFLPTHGRFLDKNKAGIVLRARCGEFNMTRAITLETALHAWASRQGGKAREGAGDPARN